LEHDESQARKQSSLPLFLRTLPYSSALKLVGTQSTSKNTTTIRRPNQNKVQVQKRSKSNNIESLLRTAPHRNNGECDDEETPLNSGTALLGRLEF
jgi:hypothetical protein